MPQAPLVQAGRDHDKDPCQEAEDQGQKLQVGGAGQVHGEDWGWGWGWELGAGGWGLGGASCYCYCYCCLRLLTAADLNMVHVEEVRGRSRRPSHLLLGRKKKTSTPELQHVYMTEIGNCLWLVVVVCAKSTT